MEAGAFQAKARAREKRVPRYGRCYVHSWRWEKKKKAHTKRHATQNDHLTANSNRPPTANAGYQSCTKGSPGLRGLGMFLGRTARPFVPSRVG